MLTHADIWAAIDRLAQDKGLSPSGLARCAGLDPTTFNRSKRVTREGKARWPSTESISKILTATETSLPRFIGLVNGVYGVPTAHTVPLTSLSKLRAGAHFDGSGQPAGAQWDEIEAPDINDSRAFAIEVTGVDLEPVFRDGDILFVSPSVASRRGDRVFVRTSSGSVSIGVMQRMTAKRLELKSLDQTGESAVALVDVVCLARILWASQ